MNFSFIIFSFSLVLFLLLLFSVYDNIENNMVTISDSKASIIDILDRFNDDLRKFDSFNSLNVTKVLQTLYFLSNFYFSLAQCFTMLCNNPDVKNMRLQIVKSKNTQSFYVVKSTYIKGKRSYKVVEKLGTLDELKLKLKNEDPYILAKKYVEELNKQEKEGNRKIIIQYSQNKIINKNNNINFNIRYIFLDKLYYDLKLNKTCKKISERYRIKYDLNKILQDLIYTRIIELCSKLSSFEVAKKFVEQPNYELHDIYRALEVISEETDFIESEVYKNSLNVINRNSKILYYDCTNYFFEIEQAEELKQYGKSKEHRQSPIV